MLQMCVSKNVWRLLDLGGLEPLKAQTLYEAVAHALDRDLVPSTLILCYPAEPYVCIGFHQELEKEVDVSHCQKHNLSIIRRSQGGGAVYLDSGQQFYQIIVKRDDPVIPSTVDRFFEKYLKPTVYVYRRLGVPAEYKPINDVVVENRKISGNGAGELGNAAIMVGNIILDFDYDSMAGILKVPSEKFRDKFAKSMKEWVSSLKRELGYVPPRNEIKKLLIEGYREIGIELVPGSLSEIEHQIFEKEVKPKHISKEWLYLPEERHPELVEKRAVKITGGIEVVETTSKAKKMIRVTVEKAFGKIRDILISGDFFMVPENALPKLEESLIGLELKKDILIKNLKLFYLETKVQTPGIKPEDFVETIMKTVKE